MKEKCRWNIILLFITVVWGAGFPITKLGLEGLGPLWFIAIRFSIATTILAVIFRKKLMTINKKVAGYSLAIGVSLFIVFALSISALNHTSATNVGFYGGLAVLFTPFLSYIIYRQTIKKKVLVAIGFAIIGIYLLSGSNATGEFVFLLGDWMAICSAIFFAITLIITERLVGKCDTDLLTMMQLFCVSIFAFIFAIIFEPVPTDISDMGLFAILFTAVFGTAGALLFQNTSQKYVSPSHVAIIFTMEPVFGAVLSFILLGENIGVNIGVKGFVGAVFIVGALFISELSSSEEGIEIKE